MSMSLLKNKKGVCKSVLFARLAADQHGLLIHVVNKFKPSWLLLSKQINDVFLLRPLPAAILLFGNKKQLPLLQYLASDAKELGTECQN